MNNSLNKGKGMTQKRFLKCCQRPCGRNMLDLFWIWLRKFQNSTGVQHVMGEPGGRAGNEEPQSHRAA